MKVRKNNKTMFGFSLDQLLLLLTVCFLVLGPKKTVEMAYRLGIQARKVKSYYDSCKKEFGLTDLEAVKNSFCNSSKDIEQKINSMSYELKKAIRSDPQQIDNAVSVSEGKKDDLAEVSQKLKPNLKIQTESEDKDLKLRIASLEVELIKIKAKLLQSKNESL